MDAKGEEAEETYPFIFFGVNDFQEVLEELVVDSENQLVCVKLMATGDLSSHAKRFGPKEKSAPVVIFSGGKQTVAFVICASKYAYHSCWLFGCATGVQCTGCQETRELGMARCQLGPLCQNRRISWPEGPWRQGTTHSTTPSKQLIRSQGQSSDGSNSI